MHSAFYLVAWRHTQLASGNGCTKGEPKSSSVGSFFLVKIKLCTNLCLKYIYTLQSNTGESSADPSSTALATIATDPSENSRVSFSSFLSFYLILNGNYQLNLLIQHIAHSKKVTFECGEIIKKDKYLLPRHCTASNGRTELPIYRRRPRSSWRRLRVLPSVTTCQLERHLQGVYGRSGAEH